METETKKTEKTTPTKTTNADADADEKPTDIGTMNSEELFAHATALDKKHKARMRTLRNLARARRDEEEVRA